MAGLPKDRASLAAALASLAVFTAGATVGYIALADVELFARATAESEPAMSPWAILGQNLGAILFMFSGAVTFGLTTLVGLAMLSAYVGATMAVGIGNVGLARLVSDTGMYAPIEFLGCLVAAAAGLYPAFTVIGAVFADRERPQLLHSYLNSLYGSLKIFALAAALIVSAAAIEAIVLAIR